MNNQGGSADMVINHIPSTKLKWKDPVKEPPEINKPYLVRTKSGASIILGAERNEYLSGKKEAWAISYQDFKHWLAYEGTKYVLLSDVLGGIE